MINSRFLIYYILWRNLPDDLIELIYLKLPITNLIEVKDIDDIAKNIYLKYIDSIIKIQRFYRRNRVKFSDFEAETNDTKRKYLLARLYITKYPKKYFYYFLDWIAGLFASKTDQSDLYETFQKYENTRRYVWKVFTHEEFCIPYIEEAQCHFFIDCDIYHQANHLYKQSEWKFDIF